MTHGNFGIQNLSILHQLFARRAFWRGLILVLLSLLCLNVVILSIANDYDLHWGPFHLTAHGLFKPLLMMNGCFILALMICGAGHKHGVATLEPMNERLSAPGWSCALLAALVILLTLAIYYPSTHINFNHYDWTHRHISASINSFESGWQLFKRPQADGFYRPLTFISLWLDYRLFGTAYSGYHVQSIALHIANSLLATWLAIVLGFGRKCAWWTGFLFAAAAVNFEPVLWPAARFDLLATMFTLIALIFAIQYFQGTRDWQWTLPASLLCYVLGIMNKESSYCFPLLILFLIGTYSVWPIQRPAKIKTILFLSFAAVFTAFMLMVRIAVYGNLGGYPVAAGVESFHFKVNLKTLISLLRAVPIPFFGVNATPAAPGWMHVAAIILAMVIFISAIAGKDCFRRKEYALVACILLSLAPVLNIVVWIGSPMQHCRYLYMPTVFVMLLIASVLDKIRWSSVLLGTFFAANLIGAISNIQVYRDMLIKTESIADSVRLDYEKQPSIREIDLAGLPESLNGVFYFGSEVVERIRKKIPNTTIRMEGANNSVESNASSRFNYRWSDADQMIHRVMK
jgi:protein O-mannosyl-transferase